MPPVDATSGGDARLEITQVRSLIGAQQGQRRTVRALGLRRIRHTVNQPDRPEIRGMIAKVAHLVEVRYPGAAVLDVEPGQEPKGEGAPPAGPSVADDEAVARQEAADDALAEPGSAALGDLSQRTPRTQHHPADRPKPPGGPVEGAADTGQPVAEPEGSDSDDAVSTAGDEGEPV